MEEASSVDSLISSCPDVSALAKDKPLLGVPFTTKDCMAVRGMSWTAGLLARKGKKAEEDAPCVQRMKAAGAICIGEDIRHHVILKP